MIKKYLILSSFILLFNGSSSFNKPKPIPVIDIDPLDLQIDESVMEGNKLKNHASCQDEELAKLLNEF